MKEFSIVVAMDHNRGIGKQGVLPWSLSGDMKHFKELTTKAASGKKNVVIMGRKTWESIPEKFRPLKDRINIVLSRSQDFNLPSDVFRFSDFEEALRWVNDSALTKNMDQVFVIGGAQIYHLAVQNPLCRYLYITHIQQSFSCDVFFPSFENHFQLIERSSLQNEHGISYFFSSYQKVVL